MHLGAQPDKLRGSALNQLHWYLQFTTTLGNTTRRSGLTASQKTKRQARVLHKQETAGEWRLLTPNPISRPAESISAIGERSSQTVYAGEGV
jgi:hypothetical protein